MANLVKVPRLVGLTPRQLARRIWKRMCLNPAFDDVCHIPNLGHGRKHTYMSEESPQSRANHERFEALVEDVFRKL